jgi:hypothetical protein
MVLDKETKKPKGFAFAEYLDEETAESARRNLHGYEINGRFLRVGEPTGDKTADRKAHEVRSGRAHPRCLACWQHMADTPQDQRLGWGAGVAPLLASRVHSRLTSVSTAATMWLAPLCGLQPGVHPHAGIPPPRGPPRPGHPPGRPSSRGSRLHHGGSPGGPSSSAGAGRGGPPGGQHGQHGPAAAVPGAGSNEGEAHPTAHSGLAETPPFQGRILAGRAWAGMGQAALSIVWGESPEIVAKLAPCLLFFRHFPFTLGCPCQAILDNYVSSIQ